MQRVSDDERTEAGRLSIASTTTAAVVGEDDGSGSTSGLGLSLSGVLRRRSVGRYTSPSCSLAILRQLFQVPSDKSTAMG